MTRLRPGAPGLRRAGGLGRRIRKVDDSGQSQVAYDYYYNTSWQMLEVRKDGSPNAHKQFVWCLRYSRP